jgi:autoinducer 2-degrading protein
MRLQSPARPVKTPARVAQGNRDLFRLLRCRRLLVDYERAAATMIVRFVTAHVKPGSENAFEEATALNHQGSIAEPGVLRFDFLRDEDEPGTYYLYEVYRDEQATVAHKETEHYKTWRATVAPLQVSERTSLKCGVIAPANETDW